MLRTMYIYTFLRSNPVSLPLRKRFARFNRFDPEKRKTLASQTNFNPRSSFASPLPPLFYIPNESYRGATRCERGNAIDIERERERMIEREREKERESDSVPWAKRTIAWVRLKTLTRSLRIISKKGGHDLSLSFSFSLSLPREILRASNLSVNNQYSNVICI